MLDCCGCGFCVEAIPSKNFSRLMKKNIRHRHWREGKKQPKDRVFSRVLRDSTPRFASRFTFFCDFYFLTSLLLPKWSSDLKYGPCPPAPDFGSRVSGTVKVASCKPRSASSSRIFGHWRIIKLQKFFWSHWSHFWRKKCHYWRNLSLSLWDLFF